MSILAFDTALGACSAAVGTARSIVAARYEERDTGHAEALMPMIAAVLDEAAVPPSAIERVAVTVGPGSFTGTRIGLAAARAFGRARGIPVVGLTTFEVLRAMAPEGREVTIAVDARRGQIYTQDFASSGVPLSDGRALGLDEAAAALAARGAGRPVLIGSAAAALGEVCSARGVQADVVARPRWPDARVLVALAAGRASPPDMPRPLYLRAPDVTSPGAS